MAEEPNVGTALGQGQGQSHILVSCAHATLMWHVTTDSPPTGRDIAGGSHCAELSVRLVMTEEGKALLLPNMVDRGGADLPVYPGGEKKKTGLTGALNPSRVHGIWGQEI